MKKTTIAVLTLTLLMLCPALAPVLAAQPTTVPCDFFMMAMASVTIGDDGEVWWTGDGTILHVRDRISYAGLFASVNSKTVMIGDAEVTTDFNFNTITGEGTAIRIFKMTFFDPLKYPLMTDAGVDNLYGIGTLTAKAVLKATSLYHNAQPGDFTGLLVATHGTGDFAKAKLTADLQGSILSLPSGETIKTLVIGEFTFHS